MAVFKCKMCGAALEIGSETVVSCDYCGTNQTLPRLDNERKTNLYDRASHFRRNNDFDKAMGIYEQILNEDGTDAEAYWSLVLCRYGIEYVEDPTTKKRVPTVNRAQFTSVFDDDNYKSALQNADASQRAVYEQEAKAINEIQKGILAISQNEEPFDVFICYKETDADGRRTPDSVLANDLYHQLTQEGFKVFFSRITLEDKLGSAYEPYIFAALNSAKVMVVLGTRPDFFNAVWVKNEWSRYLSLIKDGASKMLIPAYKDMDPYDLPEEFSHLQAQDMSKLGFMQDLIRGIKKIVGADESKPVVKEASFAPSPTTAPLLERAFMFLEDGEWENANEYCEKVLDLEPKNALAYMGKLMAELKVNFKNDLAKQDTPFDGNPNYKKAVRFADPELAKELADLNEAATQQAKKQRLIEEQQRLEQQRLLEEKRSAGTSANLITGGYGYTAALKSDGTVLVAGELPNSECISEWKSVVAISAGFLHLVCLKSDGTVVATGYNHDGECNVSDWHDITAIATGWHFTIGLKKDGTVVATGKNISGQCDVSDWYNIVAIKADDDITVGLKKDGTVVSTHKHFHKALSSSLWEDIAAITLGSDCIIGIKNDGTVVAAAKEEDEENENCNVSNWRDIVAVSANCHTLGLKKDGTVVAAANEEDKEDGSCDVSDWHDIIAISAGYHSLGLKANGTVVATGDNEHGQCNVSKWKSIVEIYANDNSSFGITSDGRVVATGDNSNKQLDVSGWKLCNNYANFKAELSENIAAEEQRMEEERKKRLAEELRLAEEQRIASEKRSQYRAQGCCQHCGGTFKGLFTKKCSSCGRQKDY